jgi:hypothetical protein
MARHHRTKMARLKSKMVMGSAGILAVAAAMLPAAFSTRMQHLCPEGLITSTFPQAVRQNARAPRSI